MMKIHVVTITVGKIALILLTSYDLKLLNFLFSFQSLLYLITFAVSRSIRQSMSLSFCKPDSVATSI